MHTLVTVDALIAWIARRRIDSSALICLAFLGPPTVGPPSEEPTGYKRAETRPLAVTDGVATRRRVAACASRTSAAMARLRQVELVSHVVACSGGRVWVSFSAGRSRHGTLGNAMQRSRGGGLATSRTANERTWAWPCRPSHASSRSSPRYRRRADSVTGSPSGPSALITP